MEFHTVSEIIAGINKTREKLINTVVNLNDERAGFRSAPEKWTVANIIEHLAKTEDNLIRLVEKLLVKAEAEKVLSRGVIEPPVSFAEIADKARGMKLEAPEAIKPGGTATISESLLKLQQSRAALLALRPRLEAVDLSTVSFPHPYFGAMNLYYWLAFIGLHEAHHLRQITDVLAASAQSN